MKSSNAVDSGNSIQMWVEKIINTAEMCNRERKRNRERMSLTQILEYHEVNKTRVGSMGSDLENR